MYLQSCSQNLVEKKSWSLPDLLSVKQAGPSPDSMEQIVVVRELPQVCCYVQPIPLLSPPVLLAHFGSDCSRKPVAHQTGNSKNVC